MLIPDSLHLEESTNLPTLNQNRLVHPERCSIYVLNNNIVDKRAKEYQGAHFLLEFLLLPTNNQIRCNNYYEARFDENGHFVLYIIINIIMHLSINFSINIYTTFHVVFLSVQQ